QAGGRLSASSRGGQGNLAWARTGVPLWGTTRHASARRRPMPPHQVQDATDGASIEKIVATPPAHRERVCTASAKEFAMHEVISIADQYREIWNETEPV